MKKDWKNSLATIDVAEMAQVFDPLAGCEQDARKTLSADRRHVCRPTRRTMLDLRGAQNALEHIRQLPKPGESIHLVTAGGYSLWHLIGAVLALSIPATLSFLGIATLGFSRSNVEDLLQMFEAGQVEQVDFIFSVYFKSVEKEACQRLMAELTSRGHRVTALRTHAKMLLMETTAGACYVVESSANLRSCHNIEQTAMTEDAGLLAFHREWFNELLRAAP